MATIYLSSTYEDLKEYRRVVFEALRQSGYQVIAMEEYVAKDQRPVEKCLEDVARADVYVGLFGFRYGYVPPPEHNNPDKLSITELEFRQAERLGKPCLAFVVSEDAPWPPKFIDSLKGERINQLRDYVLTEKMASFFSGPHQLASLVQAAVTRQLEETHNATRPSIKEAEPSTGVTWDVEKDGSPYPGLMHFTRKYAPVFFGRDSEVREILDRIHGADGRFIIISGDSGVGKSSVVDAGILPKLGDGGLAGNESCESVRMLPSQRQQPWSALMAALGALITRAGLRPDAILEDLHRAPDTLGDHIKKIMKDGSPQHALLLFVDQMEELFTSQDLEQANTFLTALYQATQAHALWVVATIRSDYLRYYHRHPDMLKVLNGTGHYALGPVKPYMMQDMIVKPAQCAGLNISEPFVLRLIHETKASSANLPFLAFVLNQLFENRTDHQLSESVYDEMGGVTGAIGSHVKTVEERIERTLGAKAEEVLPNIFQTLAKVQKEESVPTRNRPLVSGFNPNLRKIIHLLVDWRLLHTEGDGESAKVSISHEKLFEAWPMLREYVETHKKVLVDRTLLESRAQKWANMGKPWFSGLATGREYHDFQRVGGTATPETRDYLYASRRARWLLHGTMGVMVFLIGGTTWLWQKGYSLDQALLKVQSFVMSIHVESAMMPISGNTFRQGDIHGLGESWQNPVREVTVKPFALGKYEVRFEEYDRFAVATGRRLPGDQGWGRGSRPVINVSWEDARDYAEWLSEQTDKRFRLPTESEWEYAARSGGTEEVWVGTSDDEQLTEYAVYAANSGNRTASVGGKKPNELGLHDMSGNVWEWVEDCWHDDYQGAPTDGSVWLKAGGGDCGRRVGRGGSWDVNPGTLRSANRDWGTADVRDNDLGFRLALDIP